MGALLMHRPKRLLKTHHTVSAPCTVRKHCATELSVPSELNALSLFMHARSSAASQHVLSLLHAPSKTFTRSSACGLSSMHRPKALRDRAQRAL